ncbi:hypothetical protein ACHAXS_000414 [Conticribra weissflogii]
MKETGMFKLQWLSTASNKTDMVTKNLGGPEFNKFCEGLDNYYKNEKEIKTPTHECGMVSHGN